MPKGTPGKPPCKHPDGCPRPHYGNGWCALHYKRAKANNGDPGPVGPLFERGAHETCSVDGCGRPHEAKGKCSLHYGRERLGREIPPDVADGRVRERGPCSVDGCPKVSVTSDLCATHYARWKKNPTDLGPAVGRKRRVGAYGNGPDVPCRVDDCTGFAVGRGLCPSHYKRVLRYGDPEGGPNRLDAMTRIMRRVHVGAQMGSCWEWMGEHNGRGYGRTYVGFQRDDSFRYVYVHRFMFEQLVGPIPADHEIDHLCYNPGCCNPSHLEAVLPAVNKRRAMAKRQASKAAGL